MTKKIPIALIYDFDGTLAPGDMQEHSFIPSLDISREVFWEKATRVARENDADPILVYMHLMLLETGKRKVCVTKEALRDHARSVPFFPGVEEWFDTINSCRDDIAIRHYLISSGLREMVRGMSIAKHFEHIFASDFIYENGVAVAPGLGVNYTNKTQFLFRINKGTSDIDNTRVVNAKVPDEEKPMPFSHMIYIGDGMTDVPCLKVVSQEGGYGIAVYDPDRQKAREVSEGLLRDGRVHHTAPTDFRPDKKLPIVVKQMIDTICTRQHLYTMRG